MDAETMRIIEDKKRFAAQITIYPYAEVKRTLDDLAAKTAKEAVEGLAELMKPLTAKVQHG